MLKAHQRRCSNQLELRRLKEGTADVRKRALERLHYDLRDLDIENFSSEIGPGTF